MARFSRIKILIEMRKIGLIPVFYNNDIEVSKKILKACTEGGAVCIETTNRGDGAIKIFSELAEYCEKEIPQAILGAGSIVDALTGALYINYGANFIVGPEIDRELAILCNKRKIPYMPGCGTVTEIQKAHSLGVEFCKIFPGDLIGGPAFVKAVKGPCPWTFIMPTGGVCTTKESLTEWFSAGVVCVGIGSKLITKELVENRDYKKIASEVRRVINLIKEIRDSLGVSESF
ncbi:MAG: bifunctional 4-hydroxy-2-oxoglutarate aldolase/2-dehydro-3-deoxy-phosphogluconate aldolase [Bacteroidetes bacterium]|nr:bifunctional 4-hydroxy-2-oxoglutarate aldolase/2-dehydro-3-deoxy-phosphogluconate aldolase [Bacteroidota bacterium]MBE3113224.1 bifunctional 4-hydroxy-2-oxoglutarate aldolase/2-dehydro-3-deoxy-phosphogluconate aldolase [Actinomycetota bacterium]